MSDRHLCKAKTTILGKWVEGSLVTFDDEHQMIVPVGYNQAYTYPELIEMNAVSIDPSTICQCTGLKDKNDKRWQRDIFEATDGEFIQRYVIEWNEDALQWYADCISTPDYSMPLCEFKVEEIEVIGNAIDNPELLEGGA